MKDYSGQVRWEPTKNFTPRAQVAAIFGRGRTEEIVVGHWWGSKASHPTFWGVVNWFKNALSQVSAHYVVGQGLMAQMVDEDDAAWHARQANPFSIGIEINPNATDEDYQMAGWLVYDIRRRKGHLPLRGHNVYVNTQCPGDIDLARIDRIANAYANPPAPVPVVPEWQKNLVDVKAEELRVLLPQAYVYDLRNGAQIKPLAYNTPIDIVAKTTVGGQTYYISRYSREHALPNGMKAEEVGKIAAPAPTPAPAPSIPEYEGSLVDIPDEPMFAQVDTQLIEFATGRAITGYRRGQEFAISAKTTFAGKLYYITAYTFANQGKVTLKGIPASDLGMSKPIDPPAPTPDQQVDLKEVTAIVRAINELWQKLLKLLKIS